MRVGHRLVFAMLIFALSWGSQKEGNFTWFDFYEYFIMLNGINWLALLINKETERMIMKVVKGIEKWCWSKVKILWGRIKAMASSTIQFIRARMTETEFPPVLDV